MTLTVRHDGWVGVYVDGKLVARLTPDMMPALILQAAELLKAKG